MVPESRLAQLVAEEDWERDVPRLILFTEAVISSYRRWFPFQYDDAADRRYVYQAVGELLAGAHNKRHHGNQSLFALLCAAIQEQIERDAEQSEWVDPRQIRYRFPA